MVLLRRLHRVQLSLLWNRTLTMSTDGEKFTNRLALEKSPYLLQHQHNPINWYGWGQEAFEESRQTNRPIFLSVGYSTCHWCHVMERESFENHDIAKILNDNFVSIKVDREERPDVDKLYMSFVQALSGSGGWPMSVFLTPSLEPIFGGTYFPPVDSHGRPGFGTLLKLIHENWVSDAMALTTQGNAIMKAIGKGNYSKSEIVPAESVAQMAFQHKVKAFDKEYGGFGLAPKFPKPVDLEFLINFMAWSSEGTEKEMANQMLDKTFEAMFMGGIHDHIGKGFHRYSVDEEWHVPHFEKMLYDQTQLMAAYADYSLLNNGKYSEAVIDIAEYMQENLLHKSGGFYAAEDADSLPHANDHHKKEGAFCVWQKDEVFHLLDDEYADFCENFCHYFDIHEDGNVPAIIDLHNELTKKNVLRRQRSDSEWAKEMNLSEDELREKIEACKKILLKKRLIRPKPHLDSKMVTSWQGLAITGFSKAFLSLHDDKMLKLAENCAQFVLDHLKADNGDLIRSIYRSDEGVLETTSPPIHAFSDDYAFVIQGFLDLYSVNGDSQLLMEAERLQRVMIDKFWDHISDTGFFISEESDDGVKIRMQEDQDGAEPCANSVSLGNLVRLADILDDETFRTMANSIIEGSSQRLRKYPFILPKMITPLKRFEEGSMKIVIVGEPSDELVKQFNDVIQKKYIWNSVIVHLNPFQRSSFLKSDLYSSMMDNDKPVVYICEGKTCGLPIHTTQQLVDRLQ